MVGIEEVSAGGQSWDRGRVGSATGTAGTDLDEEEEERFGGALDAVAEDGDGGGGDRMSLRWCAAAEPAEAGFMLALAETLGEQ